MVILVKCVNTDLNSYSYHYMELIKFCILQFIYSQRTIYIGLLYFPGAAGRGNVILPVKTNESEEPRFELGSPPLFFDNIKRLLLRCIHQYRNACVPNIASAIKLFKYNVFFPSYISKM